jgi:hypothetical protein
MLICRQKLATGIIHHTTITPLVTNWFNQWVDVIFWQKGVCNFHPNQIYNEQYWK